MEKDKKEDKDDVWSEGYLVQTTDSSKMKKKMAIEYEQEILEPEFRPEFVESIKKAQKGKFRKVSKVCV